MRLRHPLAQQLISLWPVETGLWRIIRYAPQADPAEPLVCVRLRGLPLEIIVDPKTYAGRFVYYWGMYESGCLQLLLRLLKPGMTFIDVGAHVGLYSIIAGHAMGASGRVIAVEPQPDLVTILLQNAMLNALDNIAAKTLALGAEEGVGLLYQVSRTNDGQARLQVSNGEIYFGEPLSVKIATLSSLLKECQVSSVHGVKIDVEGAEFDVLRGFADWLSIHPPGFIFVELIDEHLKRFHTSSQEVMAFLRGHNYMLACLFRRRWHRIESPSDHFRYGNSPDCVAIHQSSDTWLEFRELFA